MEKEYNLLSYHIFDQQGRVRTKEAGVSRATANRAEVVQVEFHNRIIAFQEMPERLPGLHDQNRKLERRLAQVTAEKNQIIADLQATVTLLAQQIQALVLENERLRASMARSFDNVTELRHQWERHVKETMGANRTY